MKYARLKCVVIDEGDIELSASKYSSEDVIARIHGLKQHGYQILMEKVEKMWVKAGSMSSERVEGPESGEFRLESPEGQKFTVDVYERIGTRVRVRLTEDDPSLADFVSLVDLMLGPKPRKKQK